MCLPRWPTGAVRSRASASFALVGALLSSLVTVQPAAAQCGQDDRPWVALVFEGHDWPRAMREDVTADLRAGLRLRGIDVCGSGTIAESKPLAAVALRISASERVLVSIEVHDAITNKHVLRDIDLHAAAVDARGLLLAQAADELLRASWVELAIEDAPEPAVPPPPEIENAVRRPPPPQSPSENMVGARATVEYHSGGLTLTGGDAFVNFWFSRWLGGSIALGLRTGPEVTAPHGRLQSSAVTLSGDLLTPLWPLLARYNLVMLLGVHMDDLTVAGHAVGAARAHDRSGLAVVARAGVAGWWRLADVVRITLELGPGVPLRSVILNDTGHRVTGTDGLELHAALGVGGMF